MPSGHTYAITGRIFIFESKAGNRCICRLSYRFRKTAADKRADRRIENAAAWRIYLSED